MKDSSKNKEWERRRRDRLNDAFKKLAQILPNYDPAAKTPKIDILEKAAQFIKELRLSNSRLISQQSQSDEKSKLINELQDESNKLILRVKQLTSLLKQAKIRIPLGPSLKIGKKPGKWSNQLTPENAENSTKMLSTEQIRNDGKEETIPKISQDKEKLTINMKSPICVLASSRQSTPSSGTPLKETNTDKEALSTVKTTQPEPMDISSTIKPIMQSMSLPTTTTIILTSCPIPNPLAQPVVTRMTIAPRILPKPNDHLQKIAILPIRKPLPPKEKKRRNRAKKVKIVPVEDTKTFKATNALPIVPQEKAVSLDTKQQKKLQEISKNVETTSGNKKSNEKTKTNISKKEAPEIIDLTEEKLEAGKNMKPKTERQKNNKNIGPLSVMKKTKLAENNSSGNKELKETVSEEQNSLGQDKETAEKPEDVIKEIYGEETEEILQSDIPAESESVKQIHNLTKVVESDKTVPDKNSGEKSHTDPIVSNSESRSKETHHLDLASADVDSPEIAMAVDVPPLESLHDDEQAPMEVIENPEIAETETDKISECIARSIDLIDPPVGELMDLSGDWGDGHSPKSPISPTQMFLSMFPLLPRESIVSVSETSSSNCKTSMQYSSVRSSFFIDSMLPEENSNATEIVPHNSPTTASTNTPQSQHNVSSSTNASFITSTYNSLVGTTCLAVPPVPQRQEISNFHNLDSLNFISSTPTALFQSPNASSPKKSDNSSTSNLNDFRSNRPLVNVSTENISVNNSEIQQKVPTAESSHYKSSSIATSLSAPYKPSSCSVPESAHYRSLTESTSESVHEKTQNVLTSESSHYKSQNVPTSELTHYKTQNVPTSESSHYKTQNVPISEPAHYKAQIVPTSEPAHYKAQSVPTSEPAHYKTQNVPSSDSNRHKNQHMETFQPTAQYKNQNVPTSESARYKSQSMETSQSGAQYKKNVPTTESPQYKSQNTPVAESAQYKAQSVPVSGSALYKPQNVPIPESVHYKNQNVASEPTLYRNHNFGQYTPYTHPTSSQNSRQVLPPVSNQDLSSTNQSFQQPQKKHSENKIPSHSFISTPSVSKASTTSTSQIETSAASTPIFNENHHPALSTNTHNIFSSTGVSPTGIHGNTTIPIPVPTPDTNPQHSHTRHHNSYQHPTFHQITPTSTPARNSSKSQNYQNSYTGENSSNHSLPHPNQKQSKLQLFRPALTDFNMSARMNTQGHQETPTIQHAQSYPNLDTSNNHQSKSQVPSSAAVTYSTSNSGNNVNLQQNSTVNQNYSSIPSMQSQTLHTNQTSNQSKTHSHSASNSNVSKQQRQYSQNSNDMSGNSFSAHPTQHQSQNEPQQSHPPPNHSSTNKSQSQSQHHQSHSHSHRSSSQHPSHHQQVHSSSRNQGSKGISNNNSNNPPTSSSNGSSSRNANNPPENAFHLDFSSVIPIPVPIPAQTVRNRNSNPQTHSTPLPNPLQIAPPPPIPDFTTPPVMNFNQYHHHDPNIHSITQNYLPMRHPPPPTPTPSRATPFYLQESHHPEPVPILSHNNSNSSGQAQNNLNNSKNNFNPPAPPPPVYSHPSPHSHPNKNYFLDHTQGHSLYQHSLNNFPQPHIQIEPIPPPPIVAPPPPPIYSQPVPVHTPHRHQQPPQQSCNVGPPHQNHSQRQQPHQQNKSSKQSNPNQSNHNQNQPHYPPQQTSNSNNAAANNSNCSNQHRPNQIQNPSAANASNNSLSVPQSNNNSSRPVNWMTDPPHRKPTPVNNPFSVSKLVGNSSFVANNSYCAEALIRKNPEWNDFHFTPPAPTIAPPPPPPPPQHSQTPHTFVPYQVQNEHPTYPNFTHQYTTPSPSASSHFPHFDNSQQHHHHNHLPHHATTSSVSNFNLSSIFPEINDKRSNSNNTSSTNSNSNTQDSNTTNRCNYYGGKHAK